MNVTTIVLIPGLWMTALCWEHWVKHYSDKGYCVIAANWPGMEGDIEQLRRDPSTYTSRGLPEVVSITTSKSFANSKLRQSSSDMALAVW
jgi:hypothetical protein